jgi:hypothetical protein
MGDVGVLDGGEISPSNDEVSLTLASTGACDKAIIRLWHLLLCCVELDPAVTRLVPWLLHSAAASTPEAGTTSPLLEQQLSYAYLLN